MEEGLLDEIRRQPTKERTQLIEVRVLLSDGGLMCMKDTLINTVIKSGTVKTGKVQMMVGNDTMTIVTKLIIT